MNEPRTPQELVDEESAPLTSIDHRRLARVDRSVERGRQLRKWWENKSDRWLREYDGQEIAKIVGGGTHPDCFHLTRPLPISPETEANYGFFDTAPIDGENRDVMGLFQQTLFDEPRQYFIADAKDSAAALRLWHDDLREFTLGHLIRLTGFYATAPYHDASQRPVEPWVRPLSWCPSDEERRSGFGISQVYYKKRGGRLGKFRDADRSRVDVRTVQSGQFEWIVIGIRIHDLNLRHPATDRITLPIEDEVFAILTPDVVIDNATPGGIGGTYGFGWSVLEDSVEQDAAFVWHRPSFGFQLNHFIVQENGRVLARAMMVTERLQRLVDISPLELAKWFADRASLGVSSWGPALADRASMGLVPKAFRFGAEVAAKMAPASFPFSQFMSTSAGDFRFDPFAAFLTSMSGVPASVRADLCMSYEDVLRSLLSDVVRSQLSTIIASRGVWRAVPRWSGTAPLPPWVTA